MLNRYSSMSERHDIDYKERYEQLKIEKAESGMRYSRILNDLNKANGMLESIKTIMDKANERIEDFCSVDKAENEDIQPNINVTAHDNSTTQISVKERKFISYIRELIANFKETGSLRGIGMIAREYGVSSLTKEQFFRYGLNNEGITDDYIIGVYDKAKKHL